MASYNKLSTGWQFRVSFKDGSKYKTKSGNGYSTKKDAQAAAAEVEQRLHKGLDIKAGDVPFPEYYKQWAEVYKLGKFSFETDRNYQTAMRLVDKHFAGYRLKDISKRVYQTFINAYAETHSKATVRKIHNKVAPCLREAFRSGDIARDVAYGILITGSEGKKEADKYLNQDQTERLLDALMNDLQPTDTAKHACILQLATGARIGEIMALTFDSLDFKQSMMIINKSWDYKDSFGFKSTKNKENRTISVNDNTMAIMKTFVDQVKRNTLKNGVKNRHHLIFVGEGVNPLTVETVNKCLKAACIKAGIPAITSHGLRHTHASVLLHNNLDMHYVSERLGHKSQLTTASIYAHVIKEAREKGDQQAAAITNALFARAK